MNKDWEKYRKLDELHIQDFVFYPRPNYLDLPDTEQIQNYSIPVEDKVAISCVFFHGNRDNANMLYFHGNGEIAGEYSDIAELFNQAGVNLFVADFRGYGRSGGKPAFVSMLSDAHSIFRSFRKIMGEDGFSGSSFIMGRSLGSMSAIELAISYPEELRGVIIESGFCDIGGLLGRMGADSVGNETGDGEEGGSSRMARVKLPLLVIHGANDGIVPVAEAQKLFQMAGTQHKKLVIIRDVGHNSLLDGGREQYFKEIASFVTANK